MFSRIVNSFSSALDLNIATLSGCVDIIVVPQEDGTLRSTPFHVRFGKTKLLRSREKEVSIWVNGKKTDLLMKLGAAGEAYFEESFAQEPEDEEQTVTEDYSSLGTPNRRDHEKDAALPKAHHVEQCPHPPSSLSHPSLPLHQSVNTLNSPSAGSVPSASMHPQDALPYEDREASSVEFSLCGHLLSGDRASLQKDNDYFTANILTWDTLNRDPMLWYHPSLVCRFDVQPPIYPGKVALPLLASWITFNRPLSADALRCLMRTKVRAEPAQDKSLVTWMFGSADDSTYQSTPSLDSGTGAKKPQATDASSQYTLLNDCTPCDALRTKRTLRPTEQQLASLGLKRGVNTIEFKVTSSLQGVKTVAGSIYLWPKNAKIIVSDVDGTITKSDVLGQLMPIVGQDWSHRGVADLFSKCRENNYRILYLTARAIGQADSTRDYLFGLRQDDSARLPDGPLIMSPDRLFPSFKREVIERKPYVFKIAALRDVRDLFPKDYNPFYAGFGNRDTDHRAYVHIGIPENRVFIIDPKGTLHHINTTFAKTYESMGAISEHMFPPLDDDDANQRTAEEQVRKTKRLGPALEYRTSARRLWPEPGGCWNPLMTCCSPNYELQSSSQQVDAISNSTQQQFMADVERVPSSSGAFRQRDPDKKSREPLQENDVRGTFMTIAYESSLLYMRIRAGVFRGHFRLQFNDFNYWRIGYDYMTVEDEDAEIVDDDDDDEDGFDGDSESLVGQNNEETELKDDLTSPATTTNDPTSVASDNRFVKSGSNVSTPTHDGQARLRRKSIDGVVARSATDCI